MIVSYIGLYIQRMLSTIANSIFTEKIHNKIYQYIDPQTCNPNWDYDAWVKQQTGKLPLIHISFANENSGGRLLLPKKDRGKFIFPNVWIVVHRSDLMKPNSSYLDEICTVLHEYGHYISMQKGDPKNQVTEVGSSLLIDRSLQKSLWYDEECNAWKYAFFTIRKLPIHNLYKIILLPIAILKSIIPLYGYRMFAEGLID
jgi:hypothetical protein